MWLGRTATGFQFCKTAHKPYDRAVMCLLILCHHHAPECWDIGSDGDLPDWQPALSWMNSLAIAPYKMPPGIRAA